jgi:hypothetical protein
MECVAGSSSSPPNSTFTPGIFFSAAMWLWNLVESGETEGYKGEAQANVASNQTH